MKENIVILIVLLLCCLAIVPPLFIEGGVFDVPYTYVNNKGIKVTEKGIYFANVYYIINFSICVLCSFLVHFFKRIKTSFKYLSYLTGSWYLSALFFELSNLYCPEITFNDIHSNFIYPKALVCFTLLLSLIFIHLKWNHKKLFK
jgi:hypothetical protein